MSEIKISIESLDNSIEKLNRLKEVCTNHRPLAPETIGGGESVNQLETITKMYTTLLNEFGILLANTILFLEKSKQSYVSSDKSTAMKIKGK